MNRANIYRFNKKKKFLIHSVSQTAGGPGIADTPFIWLDENSDGEEVVNQLIYALNSSKTNLPLPKDWDLVGKNYLENVGLKKMSDFYKDCQHVAVVMENGTIKFTSMINKGYKGFVNVPDGKIEISKNKSFHEIANSLQNAFSKCE